nr:RecName: Full=Photosystem II extrinsic protein V; Short=PsbV; AltName: Full=Cytochrome c-550; AltName: Full=Cytochrome c550; AltName: Full=Low-potential cytochrome c [Aphanizomenon flos-aquae]
LELDETIRTVPLNDKGGTVVLSLEQVKEGKLFNYACAQCHAGGVTKTNQNVGLEPEALAGALPNRMKNPTTYDGEEEISEIPSIKSANIFRNLTDEDLKAIAEHILLEPLVVGTKWGGK